MVSKNKINYINNYVNYCLTNLSKLDNSISDNIDFQDNILSDYSASAMILITTFLTHYPLYKGHVAALPWDDMIANDYFYEDNVDENIIFNERGYQNIRDILTYNRADEFRDFETAMEYYAEMNKVKEEKKYHRYRSGDRTYIEDDLDIINREFLEWEEKFNKEEEKEEIQNFYESYTDEEIMELVANKLKDGERIKPEMLYQFIRNGFAHFHWEIIDGEFYIYHFNDEENRRDLEMNISFESLYDIVTEYVHILTGDRSINPTFIEQVLIHDEAYINEEYTFEGVVGLALASLKNSKYYENFKEEVGKAIKKYHYKDKEFFKKFRTDYEECVLKYGEMDEEDRNDLTSLYEDKENFESNTTEFINICEDWNTLKNYDEVKEKFEEKYPFAYKFEGLYDEYDSAYEVIRFMKKYFKERKDIINIEDQTASNMKTAIKMVEPVYGDNAFLEFVKYNDGENEEEIIFKRDYPVVLIKSLLNALFVQIDYESLDLSSINFESMKFDQEYLNQIDSIYKSKINNIDKKLDDTLNDYFKKYYTAKVKVENGMKKGVDQLAKVETKLDNYSDLVKESYTLINNNYNKIKESTFNIDNFTIIDHIRNSLAHGNIQVIIYDESNILDSDILIKDYDKGELTFGASFKLNDLLNNILKPEIKYQLDPELPAIRK